MLSNFRILNILFVEIENENIIKQYHRNFSHIFLISHLPLGSLNESLFFSECNINIICIRDSFYKLYVIHFVFKFESNVYLQGVPKKMVILSGFEFLTLGGVFLGVKNNSKNSGTKKDIRLFSKILSKWTLFIKKMQKILCF